MTTGTTNSVRNIRGRHRKEAAVLFALALLSGAMDALAANGSGDAARITVLTNVVVIDGTGGPAQHNKTIVISGDTIVEIRDAWKETEGGAKVYDLNGSYVVPGFWNMHTHLSTLLPHNHALEGEGGGSRLIRAAVNAMEGLRHGFTAVRSVDEEDDIDVTLQRVFDQGFLVGPRVFASGPAVSPTAGHRGNVAAGADGDSEIRKAVRSRVQKGARSIKLFTDEMLPDELAAAIETARSLGVPVTTHAGEPGLYAAVQAGVDAVEHGYSITDKSIELMAKLGTFYDPTIICQLSDEYIKERESRLAALGYATDQQAVRLRTAIAYADVRTPEHAEFQRLALRKAAKAGVKLLVGSDSMPVGEMGWLEMEQFVLSGVSEMETLVAATRNGAEAMGVLDRLGTIEEGKLADLVVLAKNPLEDISNIRTVKMVFKDGVSVDLEPTAGARRFYDYFDLAHFRTGFASSSHKAVGFASEANP